MSPATENGRQKMDKKMATTTTTTPEKVADIIPRSPFTDDDEFWDSNELLRGIHDYAHAHYASAWGVLMATVTRAAAVIPFNVVEVTPGIGMSPLNILTACVGPSGSGKDRAWGLACDLIPGVRHEIAAATSGEGLAATYGERVYDTDENGRTDRKNMHFELETSTQTIVMSEVVGLKALMNRSGSTLQEAILKGWAGQGLASQNRDRQKRLSMPERGYRLSMYLGVQPAEASVFVDGAGSGWTQRFLFASAVDASIPWDAAEAGLDEAMEPPEIKINLADAPDWALTRCVEDGEARFTGPWVKIYAPSEIAAITKRAIIAPAHGVPIDPLDSHRVQLTLRVAAVLSIMEAGGIPARSEITRQAWRQALHIMEASARTRGQMLQGYADAATDARTSELAIEVTARRHADAIADDTDTLRAARSMVRRLRKVTLATGSELARALDSRLRKVDDGAVVLRALRLLIACHAITDVGGVSPDGAIRTTWALDPTAGLDAPGSEAKITIDDSLEA